MIGRLFGHVRMDRLSRIAMRVAGTSAGYEDSLDQYIRQLDGAKKLLEDIHAKTSSPEGKAIVMGMHSDLFNFIADRTSGVRHWVERLKFMARGGSSSKS